MDSKEYYTTTTTTTTSTTTTTDTVIVQASTLICGWGFGEVASKTFQHGRRQTLGKLRMPWYDVEALKPKPFNLKP